MNSMKQFQLSSNRAFLTPSHEDAYRVAKGRIYLYLAPVGESGTERRLFLAELGEGAVFPGYVKKDYKNRRWVFLAVPREDTVLTVIERGSTRVLQRRFCEEFGIAKFESEGFFNALLDHYQRRMVVPEKGLLEKNRQGRAETQENIRETIAGAFRDEGERELQRGKDELYNAAARLCHAAGIPIAPYDKLRKALGYKRPDIEDIARLSNFACREVVLEEGWYKEDAGPILAFTQQGHVPVACIPEGTNRYLWCEGESGERRPLDDKLAEGLDIKGYVLYRPLPERSLTWKDIFTFCRRSVKRADLRTAMVLALVISLFNLLIPVLNQSIYDKLIPLSNIHWVVQLGLLVGSFMLGNIIFSIVKALSVFRMSSHVANDLQSAFYDRIFKLPQAVIESVESGDLTQRAAAVSQLASSLAETLITTALSVTFNVIFLIQIFVFSPSLAFISLGLLLIYCLISVPIFLFTLRHDRRIAELEGETSSRLQQFLAGIAKLRMAGAENRALYQYIKTYAAKQEEQMRKTRISGFGESLDLIIANLFTVAIYFVLIKSDLSVSFGSYMAFSSAFGTVTASAMSLLGAWKEYTAGRAARERLTPFIENVPEVDEDKELPSDLSGRIEVSNLSFRYAEDGPMVLNNLSLSVKAGEYLAVVGSSGCGKSTLLKLLLGFEEPLQGKIYYDNMDLEHVNKRELRKKMGVVLQNDSTISGSIIDNIRLTCPDARYERVMEVVREVGLEEDIKAMPMGIRTMISERGNTISGGQKQRITIARALINKPAILFFDEATSALDNVTQSKVIDTLDGLKATRIVIAHRLSTIIRCDRIVVMDKGSIAECGTYDELMAKRGMFYELATRQIA